MSRLKKYTKEWLEKLCADSYSLSEVLKKAGRVQAGGSQETLKKKIKEFDIDISHFTGRNWQKRPDFVEKYSIETLFIKGKEASSVTLRRYIMKYNLIPYRCALCGCSDEWLGYKLVLQLHHIDGDKTNNELKNLEFRCPNCHSITDSYGGKNIKIQNLKYKVSKANIDKPKIDIKPTPKPKIKSKINYNNAQLEKRLVSREELKKLIREKTFCEIGRIYKVSDNAIRKWCVKYNLPKLKKIINNYSDKEWEKI